MVNQLKSLTLQEFKQSSIQPWTLINLTPSGSLVLDGRKDSFFINDVINSLSGSAIVSGSFISITGSGAPPQAVLVGFRNSSGNTFIVPMVTNGTPAAGDFGLITRNVGSVTVAGTVTANQGTAGVADWLVLAKGDSFLTPGTDVKLLIDDSTFAGLRNLFVEPIGSQGQLLVQTPTNFNTQVELAVGATLIDPRVNQVGITGSAFPYNNNYTGSGTQTITSKTTALSLMVAPASGLSHWITSASLSNLGNGDVRVDLSGSNAVNLWSCQLNVSGSGLATLPNANAFQTFPSPIKFPTNSAVFATMNNSIAAGVLVSVQGYMA